ncbi:ArsR/SmtB family transcription factor [Streptomyces sp. NPDC054784]
MSQLPAPRQRPRPHRPAPEREGRQPPPAASLDDVAAAVADPVRRRILEMLLDGPRSAGGIARHFTISRPAVSRHLRVLRESGIVRDESVGRQRLYALDTAPLAELEAWTGLFTRPSGWEQRLDALDTEVRRTRRERRHAADDSADHPRAPDHQQEESA